MPNKTRKFLTDDVEELDFYVNDIRKFHTKQFISRFVLKNMSEYPEWRFMEILNHTINRAFQYAREQGVVPRHFSMLINSETLETPIYIPLRAREQNNIDLIMNGKLLNYFYLKRQDFFRDRQVGS